MEENLMSKAVDDFYRTASMKRFIRWPLDARATLGGLASGSLVTNTRWSVLVSDLPGFSTLSTVPYLDDVIAAVGSIATNTVAAPALGVALTFLLVLVVMYQAVTRLAVRETAELYATDRFRAGLVVVAGGFGLGLIAFLGGFEETGIPWFESIETPLAVWFLVSWLATSGAFALWTDPTSPGNPVVALLARITGEDPETYRRTEITDTWAPPWVASGVATLAAAIVVTLLGVLLGGVVAIATLLYPLPEVSVLVWIAVQLAGIHRLPYLGWVETVEIEGKLYDRLGTGTVTVYGVFVALAYLVALAVSTLLFAAVGLPVLLSGADSLGNLLGSASLRMVVTTPEVAASTGLLLALTVGPLLAALYYVAYWILAILRLPAVASSVLPDHESDASPSYPRLEGRALPAGVLVVWTAALVRVEPYGNALVQSVFILAFAVGAIPAGWALYRATVGPLDPQSVEDEERILVSAAGVQGVSNSVAFVLAGESSVPLAVLLAVLFVGMVAGAQYFGRKLHEESLETTPYSSGLLVLACLALVPVIHWQVPELSPALPAILLVCAMAMTVSYFMGRSHG